MSTERNVRQLLYGITIAIFCVLAACSRETRLQGYIEGEYIYLSSNYSGILKQLLITRGDLVKQEQLLFTLDKEPEISELEAAQDQLFHAQEVLNDLEAGQRSTILQGIIDQQRQAAANLAFSTVTLKRDQELYKQGAIGQAVLDQAQSNYNYYFNLVHQYQANLAEARQGAREHAITAQRQSVAAAQADVDRYTWEVAQKTVYAPTAGRIFDTYFKVGEFVNSQQPVASLLAPQDIKLIFYIPEPQRSQLRIGQVIYFKCDGCRQREQASIYYIAPQAEYTPPVIFSEESRQKLVYRIEAHLPLATAKRFYPGQPVDVYLR
jgi:HlyD family secretion protein